MANLSNINNFFVVEQTTGYVGIGITDPAFPLEVKSASAELALNATGGSIYRVRSTASDEFIITKNGVGDRLTISGGGDATFAGNITLGDGKKLQFGAGPDFEIWHAAGENTYLVESGEGATVFKSTDWYFQDTSSNTALHLSAAGNATFTGTSNSLVVISRDNMFVDAGQLYIGADDGATDDTFRQAVASGAYKIESRKSGTWTTRLTINSDGSVYTPNLLEAAGGLAAGDGVAGAPGFKFASDPHTGMYRIANDTIGMTTGGSLALTIGNDDATFAGGIRVNGGASTPSAGEARLGGHVSHGAQLYGSGASTDLIFLNKNGSTVMSVDTGTVNTKLAGWLSSTSSSFRMTFAVTDNSTFMSIDHTGNEAWAFKCESIGGAEDYITIGASGGGKIGFGESADLLLDSQSSVTTTTELNKIIFRKCHGSGCGTGYYDQASIRAKTFGGYEGGLNFYTSRNTGGGSYADTFAMAIDHDGNVGIGVEGIAARLVIQANSDNGGYTSSNWSKYIFLDAENTGGGGIIWTKQTSTYNRAILNNQGKMEFGRSTANDSSAVWIPDLIINASGNSLFGSTTDSASSGGGVKITTATNNERVSVVSANFASGAEGYTMYSTSAGAWRFYVGWDGVIHATSSSITAISDITLKENIKPLETGLDEVMKLQPRRFDWKNGDGENIAGFIAQEVEEVLPDLVSDGKYTNEETKKSLAMGNMIPTLVNAIQELKAEIETLKTQINN